MIPAIAELLSLAAETGAGRAVGGLAAKGASKLIGNKWARRLGLSRVPNERTR